MSQSEHDVLAEDKRVLHEMGYAQELLRRMKTFQNFAISFSIICILSGGINSFGLGFSSVGGAAIGVGWVFSCLISLFFALAMGQIGSAYPTAGGLYHWGSILGGRGIGWVTAWFNLAGIITVLAAINVGTYLFVADALAPLLGFDMSALRPTEPTTYSIVMQTMIVGAITASHALINHLGIRATTILTDLSGYLIFAVSVILTITLLICAPSLDPSRLFTFTNYSGDAGGGLWPQTNSIFYLFLLGLLLPAYTITGFDASAHTAEETVNASNSIPRGMIHSVLWSSVFGFIMLGAVVMAMPSMDEAAGKGWGAFFYTMDSVVPEGLKILLYAGIAFAQYLCGLATVTSGSRMIFAFARDGGLPASEALRKVSPTTRTPVAAIWTTAILAVAFTVYSPVYATITAACVIFLYISYLIPIMAGLAAYKRKWRHMGPFDMGGLFPIISMLCILGGLMLFYIGVQPPNEGVLVTVLGAFFITAVVWFGFENRRFKGPPMGDMKARMAEIAAAEKAVGEAGD